jgi:hypothetical protein
MLRLRMFLIAAGYEDADDCDSLRTDPIFKLAVGRLLGERGCAVLPADHLAAGECALEGRDRADDGGDGRSLLRELDMPAQGRHARYR